MDRRDFSPGASCLEMMLCAMLFLDCFAVRQALVNPVDPFWSSSAGESESPMGPFFFIDPSRSGSGRSRSVGTVPFH